ncbi:hypothetical protein PBAL39_01092 [Pedobacter sp. BAL39]|uniref:DUF3857 domain-containing protein n=1 Tax=Pedobacter sp. BAL39 TaxID=391596 RepID=UPI000155A1A5|nr:DUF3857 domain-containing protein [Pedobacter sp. BAL39]EDM38167.1 hypothetical protein PBAL39_01092 [Pedobacter sp. BAL39]
MRKYCLSLFTILCSLSSLTAQENYAIDQLPATLKSRATAVLRQEETTVDMKSPELVITTVKKAITVLNKNGDVHGALSIYYDKSRSVQRIKGSIYNAFGGLISKISMSNFSDESAVSNGTLYADNRIKSFSPVVQDYPYTIVYEVEIRDKQNLILPTWNPGEYPDMSTLQSKFTFLCQPGTKLRIREYNFKGKPEVIKTEKNDSYSWTAANIPARKAESFSPDPDTYNTAVRIAAEQFSFYGKKGSYSSWEELGKWEYHALIKDRQLLGAEVQNEIRTLVNGITDDRQKTRRLYEYMQKRTRYISVQIGIGGNQPISAAEVHRMAYGDCKGLVNYMQSILNVVNIPSMYCVVTAGNMKKSLDPDFASMDGNHIILCVPLKTDTIWLECTDQNSPFGHLGSFTDDRLVLACTAGGGKLLRTPVLTHEMNQQIRHSTLQISKDGSASGTLTTRFSGDQYDNYGELIQEPYTEQLKKLKEIYNIDNIIFKDFKLSQEKDVQPSMLESLKLEIPNYAAKASTRMYLILNAYNRSNTVPEANTRTLPVYINRGFTDEDEITYELPEEMELEFMPENRTLKTQFGSYDMTVIAKGRQLIYKRKRVLNSGTFPASSYEEFTSFMNKVVDYDRGKAVFKLKGS